MYKLTLILFLTFLSIRIYNQNLIYNWIRFGKGLNYSNGLSAAILNNNIYFSVFFADTVKLSE